MLSTKSNLLLILCIGFFTSDIFFSSKISIWFFFLSSISLSIQFRSVAQSCPALCNPMNRSTPGLPVNHQLLELTQTHVHRVSDAIQPSHSILSIYHIHIFFLIHNMNVSLIAIYPCVLILAYVN